MEFFAPQARRFGFFSIIFSDFFQILTRGGAFDPPLVSEPIWSEGGGQILLNVLMEFSRKLLQKRSDSSKTPGKRGFAVKNPF